MEESYICCRVLVRDFADYYFTLSYLSDDETIRRDDFVIVPCGRNNTRKIGRVVRVKRCRGEKLPFPLERMKYILSKTERPADWDESRKAPDFSSQRRAEKKKAEVSAGVKTEEKKQEPKPEPCLPQQENAPAPKAAAEEPSKQTAEKNSGKKRRRIWAAILLCLATAAVAMAVRTYRQTMDSYREGLREISAREYATAEQRFFELGSFRDSEAFSVYCHYMLVYENNTEYAGGAQEVSALVLRHETDWQSRFDALAVRLRTYRRIQKEREAAEAAERRKREAAEAAERRAQELKEKYGGKLPEKGMPIDALKYTSLGLPDKQTESVFGSPVRRSRSIHVIWYTWDGKIRASATFYQFSQENEFTLDYFVYHDPPIAPAKPGSGKPQGDHRHSIRDEYDSFDDFWEDNRDEYADEEEAWDAWCDG